MTETTPAGNTGFVLSPHDVATEAVRRGVDNFWRDRIADMARHASITHGHQHGDNRKAYFTGLRVSKSWPSRGHITLYREDGATVRLGHSKRTGFTVKVEKGGRS